MRRFWFLAVLAADLALVATLTAVPIAQAAFPGQNGKIAYVRLAGGSMEIFAVNPDGSGEVRLTNNSATEDQPTWSPDGTQIAFTSDRTGSYEVFVMDADGTHVTQLTHKAATFDWQPAWSPDGEQIAFTREGGGGQGVFVVPADGGTATKVLSLAHDPDWSPDGTKIAVSTARTGDLSVEIYAVRPNGTGLTKITSNDRVDTDPDWSPDGTKIAVSRFDQGDGQEDMEIWTMNANGSGETKIPDYGPAMWPAWSPDGTEIAFAGEPEGSSDWDIYRVSVTGGTWTRVTTAADDDTNPDWGPGAIAPPVGRSLTLALTDHLTASGKLSSDDGSTACIAEMTVKIQRMTGERWLTVKSVVTGEGGKYEDSIPDVNGTYRAKAPKVSVAGVVCSKAISDTVTH